MNIGDIVYDSDFEFSDGGHGDKLYVIMSKPAMNEFVFLVLTTSQEKKRPKDLGCQIARKEFFIKAGKEFPKDTWLTLWRKPIFIPTHMLQDRIDAGKCAVKGTLTQNRVNEIRNCITHNSDSYTRDQCALIGIKYRG